MSFEYKPKRDSDPFKVVEKFIGDSAVSLPIIIAVALVLFASVTSMYTVRPDEKAVVLRFGRYLETTTSGLHFKLPFGIDRVTKISTELLLDESFGIEVPSTDRMRSAYIPVRDLSHQSKMVTGDLNVVDVKWVVQYKIVDPRSYLFETEDPRQNIRDISQAIMRRVVGDRSVNDVITTGRNEIRVKARQLMQEVLDKYELGVQILSVNPQGISPPAKVRDSFNEVNKAKQEQELLINRAEQQYNKVIPAARGKALESIRNAEGYALRLVNETRGNVDRFKKVLMEYKKAPEVTRKRLYLESMQEVLTKLSGVTVVDPEVKGLLPVFESKVTERTKG